MRRSLCSSTLSRTLSCTATSSYSTSFAVQQRFLSHLTGRWANELGSKVELEFTPDGGVKGKFHTAVGDDHSWEPVHGSYAKDPVEGAYAVGFVVNWVKVRPGEPTSVTAWSGKVLHPDSPQPEIQATWILTQMNAPSWANTLIGKNTFRLVREGKPHHKEQELKK